MKKRCLNNTVKLDTFTQPGSAPVIESSEFAATPSEKGRLLNQHICDVRAVKYACRSRESIVTLPLWKPARFWISLEKKSSLKSAEQETLVSYWNPTNDWICDWKYLVSNCVLVCVAHKQLQMVTLGEYILNSFHLFHVAITILQGMHDHVSRIEAWKWG